MGVDLEVLEEVALGPAASVDGRDTYPGPHLKAAALFHGLITRRPFERGNAQLALIATVVFLNLNGFTVEADDDDLFELTRLTTEGSLSILTIATALEAGTSRLQGPFDGIDRL